MFRPGILITGTLVAISVAQMPVNAVPEGFAPASVAPVQAVEAQVPVPMRAPDTSAASAQAQTPSVVKNGLYPVDELPIHDSLRIQVLDIDKAEVRDVLRGLGMQYNVNIFMEPEVGGPVSFYLSDISLKNAVDFIIRRSGFVYTVENGIIKVYKYKEPPQPSPQPVAVFRSVKGMVDIDFKDVPLQQVIRLFCDSARINAVAAPGIDKKITFRLTGMHPVKALKALAESNDLECTENDGIFYINKPSWGDDKGAAATGAGGGNLRRLSITVNDNSVALEVDNAPLDQLVRAIAVQSGINIVIYDKLTGEITAKLDGVPVDNALRFLLQNTKFTFWKENGIYFIGSREMNQQKTTVIIPLRHIMAEEATITKVLPPNIISNAVVKFNSEQNSIVVIGSSDVVAQAEEFIGKIDKPVPQVLIEALVVDFNVNKIRDYGLSLFTQGFTDSSRSWYSESFLPEINLKPGRKRTQRVLQEVLDNLGISKIVDLPQNFRASIHALESADIVKVHSTPQIATVNGNAASITIGETRYYKLQKETAAAVEGDNKVIGTDERFEVIKFNTQLNVTPWVMDKGYVMVKIRPEFNIPRTGGDESTPPNVDTRVIESMVRLHDGQTIVLGGQRQTENVVNRTGVPVLGSIPVLGWLFSSRTITKTETQMMIFLTPHVYYGDDNAVSPDDYFGREIGKMLDKYDIDKSDGMKRSEGSQTGAGSFAKKGKNDKRKKAGGKGSAAVTPKGSALVKTADAEPSPGSRTEVKNAATMDKKKGADGNDSAAVRKPVQLQPLVKKPDGKTK